MGTLAAVMTGKGSGAIACVGLFGPRAAEILANIFRPSGKAPIDPSPGNIIHGFIVDGERHIDHVVVGFHTADNITINCHGNPLIVCDLVKILALRGAEPVDRSRLTAAAMEAEGVFSAIAIEASVKQGVAAGLAGARIIARQAETGLGRLAGRWKAELAMGKNLAKIQDLARMVLTNSLHARLFIDGCRAAIAGPSNSGKSTLLNRLAGRQKSIVSEASGTTRDWVWARRMAGELPVEFIDTAGFFEAASNPSPVDAEARRRADKIIDSSDIVLLVFEAGTAIDIGQIADAISGPPVLPVMNKCDLPGISTAESPPRIPNAVRISAKTGAGIEQMLQRLPGTLGLDDFNFESPVCFTPRQRELLERLTSATSCRQALRLVSGLLDGPLGV